MTWVERILATPCPDDTCSAEAGQECASVYVHASRIAAAEGAAASAVHECGGYRGVGPWHKGTYACGVCGVWVTLDAGGETVYSDDRGATWHPGPDACPGRRP